MLDEMSAAVPAVASNSVRSTKIPLLIRAAATRRSSARRPAVDQSANDSTNARPAVTNDGEPTRGGSATLAEQLELDEFADRRHRRMRPDRGNDELRRDVHRLEFDELVDGQVAVPDALETGDIFGRDVERAELNQPVAGQVGVADAGKAADPLR